MYHDFVETLLDESKIRTMPGREEYALMSAIPFARVRGWLILVPRNMWLAVNTRNLKIRQHFLRIQTLKLRQRKNKQVHLCEILRVAGPRVDLLTDGDLTAGSEAVADSGNGVGLDGGHCSLTRLADKAGYLRAGRRYKELKELGKGNAVLIVQMYG